MLVVQTSPLVTRKYWNRSMRWTLGNTRFLNTTRKPTAPNAPTRPCTSPSSMYGMRMNQFVAPTSFMTSISRRREVIAVNVVLRINSTDTMNSTTAATRRPKPMMLVIDSRFRSVSLAYFTSYTPGLSSNCLPSCATASALLSTGTTRYEGGSTVGEIESMSSCLSAKSFLNSSYAAA